MKKKLVLMTSMLLWLGMVCACSSDDDDVNPLLFNEWVLVSYGNESNEVLKEANGYYYSISFHSDGTYSGLAYGNRMDGKYKGNGHEIKFFDGIITQAYNEGSDPDMFFLEHGCEINSYSVTDKELRLYYSKNQYFKFRINSSEDILENAEENTMQVITDALGIVRYDENKGEWYIYHYIDGTIDGVVHYYPEEIDSQFMRKELEVIFSGIILSSETEYNLVGGLHVYKIRLTNIQLK